MGCEKHFDEASFGLGHLSSVSRVRSVDLGAVIPAAALLGLPVASLIDVSGFTGGGVFTVLEPQGLVVVLVSA